MRALLLAAGLGTRLRPVTDTIPKCLVPIFGKPLLQIWLERLAEAGIDGFLVNTHYLVEQVESFIASSIFRERITVVHESELLGTAGTLMKNLAYFDGQDGMLIHADNYCLADLAAFRRAHDARPEGCLMTMMIFRTDDPSSCGIVELDDEGVVTGFHEKVENPPGNLANGAVYILSAELLSQLSEGDRMIDDFSTQVLPRYVGAISTYCTSEKFVDIGTWENYRPFSQSPEGK